MQFELDLLKQENTRLTIRIAELEHIPKENNELIDTFSTASVHRLNLGSFKRFPRKNAANSSFSFDFFDSQVNSLGFSSANMKQLKHVSTESLIKARRSLGFDSKDNDKIFGDFTLEEKNELLSQQPNSKVTTEHISHENCVTKNDYKMSESSTALSTLNFKKTPAKRYKLKDFVSPHKFSLSILIFNLIEGGYKLIVWKLRV
ncbi:1667_t:CDS:2 [Diversispora eburnea]|uniref:1667_t:CDS:1 n=1 Tax=Diversispora eburnea TaxID=1213867 RepID=A0A9N8W4M8_9GLOM|nr:1667_t:CDS:2 [Diversispora eburnea]